MKITKIGALEAIANEIRVGAIEQIYNAGSGPIIRADAPSKKTGISSMMFALRAPW